MISAFRIPMAIPFRGVTQREGLLIEGPCGWGELSTFPDYPAGVVPRWALAAIEAAQTPWPPALRTSIPVNVTVPAVPPGQAHAIAASSGCSTAKVKVGEGDDEGRVEAVRDALGPHGRIRLDVNGAWDLDTAEKQIRSLAAYGLEYVEQPVASLSDMAALRRRVDVPIAADESVRHGDDPAAIRRLGAADVVVLKVQPLGGVWPCLRIAEQVGLPAVVSSALETSVGIAAGLALAACLPELPFACGLATVPLLAGDVVSDPLLPTAGMIELRRPSPDPGLLKRWEPKGSPVWKALPEGLRAAWPQEAVR